ncbi:histone H3 [Klebsormidium nitens]|uniref:Histone H3 n=1 Tax=Klebsormidium nitens TaxID=105231 RepID=A0A1Y1IUM8_KLENI|nr:histone H3 [Klebsormidium nitens]|eukprot:GAQ93071.1 histone H3 [Klebsormidium nitens]
MAALEDEVGNLEGAQVPRGSVEPAIDLLELDETCLHANWGLEDYLSYVETLATQNKWSPKKKAEAEAHYLAQFAELRSGEQSPLPETMQTEEGAPEEVQKERRIMSSEKYRAQLDDIARNNAPFENPLGHSEPEEDDPEEGGHLNAAGEDDPDAPTESELQAEMTFKQHAREEEAPAEDDEEEEGEELQSMLGDPGRDMDPAEQHRRHKAAVASFGKTSRELLTAGKQPRKKPRSKATGRKPSSVWAVVGGKKPVPGAAALAGKPEAAGATEQKGSGGAQKKKVPPTGAIGKPAAGEGKQKLAMGGSGKAVVGGNRKTSAALRRWESAKRPRRYKPGTIALREIRKYQKSTDNLIPRSTFARIVKRMCNTYLKREDLSRKPSSVRAVVGGKKPVPGAAALAGKPEAAGATAQKGSGGAPKKKVPPTGAIGKPAAGEGKQKLAMGGSGKAVVGGNRKTSAALRRWESAKRPRRYKPGTIALREIRKYQKSTDNLIPRSTFARIVKRMCNTYLKRDLR